jgi:hypothetical protein
VRWKDLWFYQPPSATDGSTLAGPISGFIPVEVNHLATSTVPAPEVRNMVHGVFPIGASEC